MISLKRFAIIIGLTLLALSTLGQLTLADATALSISVSDRGTAFSLMQRTASGFFAINVSDLRPYQPASHPVEVFPLLYMAAETDSSPELVRQRRHGHGWGRTAKEMGMPANSHGKYMSDKHRRKYATPVMMDDPAYEEMMVVRFLDDYYGADPDLLFYWHSRGLSYDDLFIGYNLGARLHRSPREFFTLRLSGRNWEFIARRNNISYALLSRPVSPARRMSIRQSDDYQPEAPT